VKRYHVRASSQAVQVVRPGLHHLPALRQVLGEVVGGADVVPLGVRELALDGVAVRRESNPESAFDGQ